MNLQSEREPVITTNKARCRDCYRCVRVCPVKAIRVTGGQAAVVRERCISCGTCVRECPQGAKSVRRDAGIAATLIASERNVAASVAPSFAAAFEDWERARLPSALRRLGFRHVAETAVGAYHVAAATAEHAERAGGAGHLCSSCPAFVRYAQLYAPARAKRLAPVVSPMLAHARHIRTRLGEEWAVVFIGPCIAKKNEADGSAGENRVDCALTFAELREWLAEARIDLAGCEESRFDESPAGAARLFPLEGGCLRAAGLSCDPFGGDTLTVSGAEAVLKLMHRPLPAGVRLIEPLFCSGGCVGGPALGNSADAVAGRAAVLEHANSEPAAAVAESETELGADYSAAPLAEPEFPEEELRRVLALTGKNRPEDELNCGACGYASCREKARAVLLGLAEPEMCVPFMRLRAEQRMDKIIESTPNGIMVADSRLIILGVNPAFKRMFTCSDALVGQHVSYLMDPHPFETALADEAGGVTEGVVEDQRYGLIYRHLVYALPEEGQVVGIFLNLTEGARSRQALERLQADTVAQARQLLDHQVNLAQTLARLLGESTAEGEMLVEKLMELAGGNPKPESREFKPWAINTTT